MATLKQLGIHLQKLQETGIQTKQQQEEIERALGMSIPEFAQQKVIFEKIEEQAGLTTANGADIVGKAKETTDRLAGAPKPEIAPTELPKPPERTITFINDDGQTITRKGTDEQLKQMQAAGEFDKLFAGGFDIESSDAGFDVREDPLQRKERLESESAFSELETAKNNLRAFDVSNDPALLAQQRAIEQQWNARITEMQEINRRSEKSFETLGFRIGAQFTGGVKGGVFGGVISEEERQGAMRIADLEAQKQAALAQAKSAYEKQKWSEFVTKAELAESHYDRQLKELEILQKAQADQSEKLKEEQNLQNVGISIAAFLDGEVTNPNTIFSVLTSLGMKVTPEQVSSIIKDLTPEVDLVKLTGDAQDFKSFVNVGLIDSTLPVKDQWEKYLELTKKDDVLSAIDAARLGVPFGTTKSQAFGIIPQKDTTSFDLRVQGQIDAIRNQFSGSPIVKNFNDVQGKLLAFANIIELGVGGPGDLALVFDFMKALDPNSVVRES